VKIFVAQLDGLKYFFLVLAQLKYVSAQIFCGSAIAASTPTLRSNSHCFELKLQRAMQSLTASRPAQQISTVSFIVYVHNAHAAKQTH